MTCLRIVTDKYDKVTVMHESMSFCFDFGKACIFKKILTYHHSVTYIQSENMSAYERNRLLLYQQFLRLLLPLAQMEEDDFQLLLC